MLQTIVGCRMETVIRGASQRQLSSAGTTVTSRRSIGVSMAKRDISLSFITRNNYNGKISIRPCTNDRHGRAMGCLSWGIRGVSNSLTKSTQKITGSYCSRTVPQIYQLFLVTYLTYPHFYGITLIHFCNVVNRYPKVLNVFHLMQYFVSYGR